MAEQGSDTGRCCEMVRMPVGAGVGRWWVGELAPPWVDVQARCLTNGLVSRYAREKGLARGGCAGEMFDPHPGRSKLPLLASATTPAPTESRKLMGLHPQKDRAYFPPARCGSINRVAPVRCVPRSRIVRGLYSGHD